MKQSRSLKVSLCKGCMKKVIFPIVLAQSPLGIVLWNHMTIKQRRFLSLYKHGTKNKVSFPIRIEPLTFRLTWHFRALFDWMPKNQDQSIHSDQSEERKNTLNSQWEIKVKRSKPTEAWENTGDQVVIGVSFASACLRGWREFSEPITEQS